jgi:hypothetical protein
MTEKQPVMVDLQEVDWVLLRQQKTTLVALTCLPRMKAHEEYLEGLINLLDYIQDEAAEILGEEAVFGDLESEDE